MKQYLILTFIFFLSCQDRQSKIVSSNNLADTIQPIAEIKSQDDKPQLEEFFIDSLNIGRKSFNKIELSKYRTADSNYVVIKFFSKKSEKWNLRNEFHFEKDGVTECDPKMGDFNNDGLNDIICVSNVAARGANEIRRLFIYDKRNDNLVYINNSDNYPNMLYNKELNCIDAFLIYAGSSTVFLKINGDSLREFASVELFDGLTITTYDREGKGKIIYQNTTSKTDYIRYKNFNPLQEYDDY